MWIRQVNTDLNSLLDSIIAKVIPLYSNTKSREILELFVIEGETKKEDGFEVK